MTHIRTRTSTQDGAVLRSGGLDRPGDVARVVQSPSSVAGVTFSRRPPVIGSFTRTWSASQISSDLDPRSRQQVARARLSIRAARFRDASPQSGVAAVVEVYR